MLLGLADMMAEMLDEIANAKKKKLNKHLLNWDTVGFCFFVFFIAVYMVYSIQ